MAIMLSLQGKRPFRSLKLKIIINASCLLEPMTGIGNYVCQVLKWMASIAPEHDYTYFYQGQYSKKLNIASLESKRSGLYVMKHFISRIPIANKVAKTGWRWLRDSYAGRSNLELYDIYFEPSIMPIELRAKKMIVTVHDLSFYIHPEWHLDDAASYLRRNFIKRIPAANRIITVSETIKQELVDLFSIRQNMIDVIYNGIDHDVFKVYSEDILEEYAREKKLPQYFILFVGSIEPRKNLLRLLDAYEALPIRLRKEVKLVLAGFRGWNNKEIMKRIDCLSKQVYYYGYVSNLELAYLYNLTGLFVYPSLYEGFGLPPLEAMACGAKTLISDIPVHRELYGDVALFTDPYQVDKMVFSLETCLTNTAGDKVIKKAGIERAREFSWKKSAQEHLLTIEKTLG
jgi:glycosyltransferase involved in cell wall biosynthesis